MQLFFYGAAKIKLRKCTARQLEGSDSRYDFVLQPDGLIHPPTSSGYLQTGCHNGVRLWQQSIDLWEILGMQRGRCHVRILPAGLVLPSSMVLQQSNAYSWELQTAIPVKPSVLNAQINALFEPLELIPKKSYFSRFTFVPT